MNELTSRLEKFSIAVIAYCKSQDVDLITKPLISQLVRSATSIGANYTEAQSAISKNDFRSKVFIAKKECAETAYWLKLLSSVNTSETNKTLQQECAELLAIFHAITNKTKPEAKILSP